MSPNGGEDKIFKAIGTWENVNWHTVEKSIFLLQERIFKASNGESVEDDVAQQFTDQESELREAVVLQMRYEYCF